MIYIQKVNNLIALVNIFEEYENFMSELNQLQQQVHLYMDDIAINIDKLKEKNKPFVKKKIKKFYESNQKIIDIIFKYTTMSDFLSDRLYYSFQKEKANIKNFYDYINEHKEDIDKIKELLLKISLLDVEDLQLNNNLNLEDNVYSVRYIESENGLEIYNTELTYLANIIILPNYQTDVLKYKTTNSPYELEIKSQASDKNLITVNNLLFDSNLLPDVAVNTEEFAKNMVMQKKSKEKDYELFRNMIKIDLSIDEINNNIKRINDELDLIKDVKSKKELKNILRQLNQKIKTLGSKTNEYYEEQIEEDSFLNKEIKKKELEYIKRV